MYKTPQFLLTTKFYAAFRDLWFHSSMIESPLRSVYSDIWSGIYRFSSVDVIKYVLNQQKATGWYTVLNRRLRRIYI